VLAWFIVGNGGFGKSSTIRALSGVGRTKAMFGIRGALWNIDYTAGTAMTFVLPVGLQELPVDAQTFEAAVNRSGASHVVGALRYYGANGLPDAASYIHYFIGRGWLVSYATLGALPPLSSPGGMNIPTAGPRAAPPSANGIAAQLRSIWPFL